MLKNEYYEIDDMKLTYTLNEGADHYHNRLTVSMHARDLQFFLQPVCRSHIW